MHPQNGTSIFLKLLTENSKFVQKVVDQVKLWIAKNTIVHHYTGTWKWTTVRMAYCIVSGGCFIWVFYFSRVSAHGLSQVELSLWLNLKSLSDSHMQWLTLSLTHSNFIHDFLPLNNSNNNNINNNTSGRELEIIKGYTYKFSEIIVY